MASDGESAVVSEGNGAAGDDGQGATVPAVGAGVTEAARSTEGSDVTIGGLFDRAMRLRHDLRPGDPAFKVPCPCQGEHGVS